MSTEKRNRFQTNEQKVDLFHLKAYRKELQQRKENKNRFFSKLDIKISKEIKIMFKYLVTDTNIHCYKEKQ